MYSTYLLQTGEECDALLTQQQQDRENLVLRRSNLQRQKTGTANTTLVVSAELARVNARLSVADSILSSLPDGIEKRKEEANKKKLEWQRQNLLNRQESYGAFAVLETEGLIAQIDKRIEAVDALITAIETRKTEFPG